MNRAQTPMTPVPTGTTTIQTLIITAILTLSQNAAAEDPLNDLIKKYSPQDQSAPATRPASAGQENSAPTIRPPRIAFPHTIQVASYSVEREAEARVAELRGAGHDARYEKVTVGTQAWYRVTIGTFGSRYASETYLKTHLSASVQKTAILMRIGGRIAGEPRSPASVTEAKPSSPRAAQLPDSAKSADETTAEAGVESPSTSEPELTEGLLGNWGGVKPTLMAAGVSVELKYKGDLVQNLSGGLKQKTDYLGHIDVLTDFNLEKIASLKGLNLILYGLGNHGADPTEYIGDSFASSNIEASDTFKLYEAYLHQTVDDRFTMIFGLRDLNADYYVTDSAANLLNSAFGIGPSLSQTGVNGPSIFPTTALALTFRYESPTSLYFQAGIFNATAGDPDRPYGTRITTKNENGYLYVWETGLASDEDAGRYKYGVGAWNYSAMSAPLDSTKSESRNSGLYFLVDQSLCKNISAFAKHGVASPAINQFSSSTELGIAAQGLIGSRPDDVLSLGYAIGSISDDYETANTSKRTEAVVELNYRMAIGHGIALTPDYQYIKNPGVTHGVKDAQIGALRIEIQF